VKVEIDFTVNGKVQFQGQHRITGNRARVFSRWHESQVALARRIGTVDGELSLNVVRLLRIDYFRLQKRMVSLDYDQATLTQLRILRSGKLK
jgi:hypothetical protein